MSNKIELCDELLNDVTGGQITYTWDEAAQIGTIGINDNNPFILLDKAAFVEYYNSVKGTGIKESAILNYLLKNKIIKKK